MKLMPEQIESLIVDCCYFGGMFALCVAVILALIFY